MADATFDGDNLLIQLPAGQTTIDVERELYSAWKEWLKTGDNAKYPLAMRTVAGDTIPGGQTLAPTFFVRNDLGWRLQPPDEDIEISLSGNLYPEDTATAWIDSRPGRTILITGDRSANALVVTAGSGVTSADIDAIVAAVYAYAIETGVSFQTAMRAMAAVAAGDASGGPAGSSFKAIGNPAQTRVDSVAQQTGDRTVTVTP